MIEQQQINGRDVWLRVDAHPIKRENANIIPREYFTATYYTEEPVTDAAEGTIVRDEEGGPRLFESPVAALAHARKQAEGGRP